MAVRHFFSGGKLVIWASQKPTVAHNKTTTAIAIADAHAGSPRGHGL